MIIQFILLGIVAGIIFFTWGYMAGLSVGENKDDDIDEDDDNW